jgi:predicted metalloprotease with PDZ domain
VRGRREDRPRAWLGIKVQTVDGRVRISHVAAGSPGQQAGLIAGDELVALAGRRIAPDSWETTLDRLIPGVDLACHVFRDQQLVGLVCQPVPAPRDTCYLTLDPEADPDTLTRRNAWLGIP